jgi:hypothetical protein
VRQTNQAFAGKLRRGDLDRIALVDERELEGAGIEQGADLRGSERGDPVEPGRSQLVANAGRGDHPAVPDQHHPRQAKALLEVVDLRGERHRVGGVAGQHFDGHQTAVGRAQQARDDLQLAFAATTFVLAGDARLVLRIKQMIHCRLARYRTYRPRPRSDRLDHLIASEQ